MSSSNNPVVATTPNKSSSKNPTHKNLNNNQSRICTSRRSSRVLQHDPVIAPGGGTAKDLQRLAQQLSHGGPVEFPVAAVEALMKSRGRGIHHASEEEEEEEEEDGDEKKAAPAALWADFMKDEGVQVAAPTATNPSASKRTYIVSKPKKKLKLMGGVLLQAGTLDVSIVGRSKSKMEEAYHLTVPTRLLPSIQIAKVFTASHAAHSFALDVSGTFYGWGRNETSQLGPDVPTNVGVPQRLDVPGSVRFVALGRGHSILAMTDDTLWAVGSNKGGQCGVRTATDVPNWRKCVLPDDSNNNTSFSVAQISCGEDFSVLLTAQGHIYSTGSSEFGQLGNGETGEYFVAANKLAFANCNVFTRRSTFCHAPGEKLHINNTVEKCVPINEDIKIESIACGKHHTIAVEAASEHKSRVFSWGCGNYGCLGHGVQADEYFPRMIGLLQTLPIPVGVGGLQIAAGAHCSLLRTNQGHLYYWGKHRMVGEAVMRPQLVDALANNQHVVTHFAAGGQTVVCCTQAGQTVAWGQGPHGELGLGAVKSSSKPQFVTGLEGCHMLDLACGYGHTLFVVSTDTKEDKDRAKRLPELDTDSARALADELEAKASRKKS